MAGNESIRKIELAVDFVESELRGAPSLDEISARAGLSKFHLDRIFKAAAGMGLMDYARRRRLSRSVLDLLETDRKVIDLALEYGFSFEQSYIRSFKRTFGLSPDRFRRERREVRVTDRLDLGRLTAMGDEDMLVEPSILIRPAFHIVGQPSEISVVVDSEEHTANALGNDFYFNRRRLVPRAKDPNTYIGYMRPIAGDPDRVLYMPSVQVAGPVEPPEGMVLLEVPTGKYAVFKYIGFRDPRYVTVNEYRHIYAFVYSAWLPASAYALRGDFRFESINGDLGREDYCEVDLYIPIEDRS
jgi:AraC family transcriptional regulator